MSWGEGREIAQQLLSWAKWTQKKGDYGLLLTDKSSEKVKAN